MNIQFIKDENQNDLGVFIPLKILKKVRSEFPNLILNKTKPLDKVTILDNILKSVEDLKAIENKSKI